jgi:hypothetical protein
MKKVKRPVIKSKESKMKQREIMRGVAKGDNQAIAEALRRAGI